MSEHSPTPWKHSDTEHAAIQDANGCRVCFVDTDCIGNDDDVIDRINLCVNAHDDLVTTLSSTQEELDRVRSAARERANAQNREFEIRSALVAALSFVRNWMTDGIFAGEELSDVEVHDRIIGRIDAALARAKGEGHE